MPDIRTINQVEDDLAHIVSVSSGKVRSMEKMEEESIHIVNVSAGEARPMKEMENVIIYSGGLPEGGKLGDLLAKRSNADYEAEWITPATRVEQDNTRPITSAAVYTEIGNINALLATI